MNLAGKIIETYVRGDGNESLALGKRLQRLRKLAGLTQADFSQRLKISQGALSRLESRTDIHVSTVKQYVEALGAKLQINAAFSPDSPIAFRIIEAFDAELIDEKQLLLPIFDDDVFRPQRDVVLSINRNTHLKSSKEQKQLSFGGDFLSMSPKVRLRLSIPQRQKRHS